jgi:signal transduction histidine kinase/CheY-like chemotaxis protein
MQDHARKDDELRKQAESRVGGQLPDIEQLSRDEIAGIIHNLQVYQVELELQNEEMQELHTRLQRSRDELSYLYNHAPVGYLTLDESGLIVKVNETFCEMVHAGLSDLPGRPFSGLVNEKDRDIFLSRFRAFFKSPREKSIELRLNTGSKDFFHARVEGRHSPEPVLLPGSAGSEAHSGHAHEESGALGAEPPYLLLAVTDISRRIEAEEALAGNERRFRRLSAEFQTLLDAIPDQLMLISPDMRLRWANNAAARAVGRPADQLQGALCHELWENRTIPCDNCPVAETFRSHSPEMVLMTFADGKTYEIRTAPIFDSEGGVENVIEIRRDVTESRMLEEQLRHAQKMESVGMLAGGIAHDFNNLLMGIVGNVSLAMEEIGAEGPLYDNLREIEKAADRATSITRQLLAFSRRQVIEIGIVNLNELLQHMKTMLGRLVRENINFDLHLDPQLKNVEVDPAQIEQVIVNLVVNARDAMPDGGDLTISTLNAKLSDEFCMNNFQTPGGAFVKLEVADTGVGMDSETRERIFEPFFTTKPKEKGTGLGLATVYGAVKQNGGFITVHSREKAGSTFTLYFPAVRRRAGKPAAQRNKGELPTGTETVMVVEDEPMVRKLILNILARLGYTTVYAEDGNRAIELARDYRGDIHLLITDMVMPGMDGSELANLIARIRPGIKVLYTSGYSDDVIARHGILEAGLPFIGKPYTPKALAGKVREVLDSDSDS